MIAYCKSLTLTNSSFIVLGILISYTGGHTVVFCAAGGSLILAALLCFPLRFCNRLTAADKECPNATNIKPKYTIETVVA